MALRALGLFKKFFGRNPAQGCGLECVGYDLMHYSRLTKFDLPN